MKDKASKEELIGKFWSLKQLKTELEGRKYTKDLFELIERCFKWRRVKVICL